MLGFVQATRQANGAPADAERLRIWSWRHFIHLPYTVRATMAEPYKGGCACLV